MRLLPRLAPALAGSLCTLLLTLPAANARADAPAPSLAARTDPGTPWVAHGVSVDAVAQGFGAHGLRLDLSLNRFFGAVAMPAWHRGRGPGLGLGLTFHPLGRGLEGLELALLGEGRWRPAQGNERRDHVEASLSFELGYRWVFQGAQIGLAAGARMRGAPGPRFGPTLRLLLGWAV